VDGVKIEYGLFLVEVLFVYRDRNFLDVRLVVYKLAQNILCSYEGRNAVFIGAEDGNCGQHSGRGELFSLHSDTEARRTDEEGNECQNEKTDYTPGRTIEEVVAEGH
jgi:hypothetical protein